ncbi:MAG: zinc-dependent metalloprotease, partial [Mycobacterium sp.]
MADLPFGFSPGDDPERDKRKKDPSGDPFGLGGEGFDMSDLGQIFSRLGEMFSGAGNVAPGQPAGPVNYDLARRLASSAIGFVAPIPESTA